MTRLRLAVLCPHFEPDTAPTGTVMTRIVHELAARGHELHVVTALPWYRTHSIEPGWEGRRVRREQVPWGSITRVDPFPGDDKRNLLRRAVGFAGFSVLTGVTSWRGGRVDAVIAMSPPLTMGLTGWTTHLVRRGPLVFNIQDVFPDVAIEVGAIKNPTVIKAARWLERFLYRRSDAVTVLSEDLRLNLAGKLAGHRPERVRVIPNFVDTDRIRPASRVNAYRDELGLGDRTVVMYAGNIGYSQSVELMVGAARRFADRDDVVFVVNGSGSGRAAVVESAEGLDNIIFVGLQPKERLSEVLAAGDIHTVLLRRGLARSSVPSKMYSILASGRPCVASVDDGTEVARSLAAADGGVAVPPEDVDAFCTALQPLLDDAAERERLGANGRRWVEAWASPEAVAESYEALFAELLAR